MAKYRTVTGTIEKFAGTAWADADVLFVLRPGSTSPAPRPTTFPSYRKRVRTESDGSFEVELWANAEAETGSEYICELPGGEVFAFILPVGTAPIDIAELRTLYAGPSSPPFNAIRDVITEEIGVEVAAREAADAAEAATRAAADTAHTNAIALETSTRAAADAAEIAARQAADVVLTNTINGEANVRANADALLQADIATEAAARAAAVAAEATARGNADAVLQAALDLEETARASADNTLAVNLAAEIADRESAVDAEATARQDAVDLLQSNIDTEAGARAAADTSLAGGLAAEIVARTDADAAIAADLADETTARAAHEARIDNPHGVTTAQIGAARLDTTQAFTQPQTGPFIDKGGALHNVMAYAAGAAIADGTTDARPAFVALELAGDHGVVPAGTYLISSNLTLSKAWTFAKGATIKPANGVTVTMPEPDAGAYQIFDTSLGGSIAFTAGTINVVRPEWWGTVATATVQAAVTAAVAAGATVELPVGTTAALGTITATGSITIRGQGSGKTIWTHTASSHGLDITAATDGSVVRLEGFTMAGPAALLNDNGYNGIRWIAASTFNSRFYVSDVRVTGTFDAAIQRSGGGYFEIDGCEFYATDVPVAFFESSDTADSAYFVMTRTRCSTPASTDSSSVGVYIHPHIRYTISKCDFDATIDRYGVYENGSPNSARKPATISDCHFRCAPVQTKTNGITNLIGCTGFGATGNCLIEGEVNFVGGSYENMALMVCQTTTFNRVGIKGVEFRNAGTGSIQGLTGSELNISGCDFYIVSPVGTQAGSCISVPGAGCIVNISNVSITDRSTVESTNQTINIAGASSTIRIDNLRMYGIRATNSGGLLRIAGDPTSLDVSNCIFDTGGTGTTNRAINLESISANKLHGGNNRFIGFGASDVVYSATGAQQRMTRRAGVNPTNVASAATIVTNSAAWLNYDTHVITGSTTINTLSQPYPCAGIVRLVVAAGATWATSNAGNITPLTTAARTAGTVVTLLWEPTAARWLEV